MTTPLLRPSAIVVIGPVDIDYPDQIVYTQNFEVDTGGWAAGASSVATREPVFGGGFNYWLTRTSGSGTAIAQRTFTGLTIGRQYTIAGFVGRAPNVNVTAARFGVTGIGLGPAVTPADDASTTQPVSYTFTATATSHVVTMQANVTSGGSQYAIWDDITLTALAWFGPGTIETPAESGDVTLDAATVPYATARVELPLVDLHLVEAIDPREGQRVTLTGGNDYAGTSRVFDLGLRAREVDHRNRVIRLDLASDEAMLMDYAPLTNDTGARAHASSLRAVCNYVLGKIGASLEAGTDDADLSPVWSTENLVSNPRAASNMDGWIGVSATLTRMTDTTGHPVSNFNRYRATWNSGALWGFGANTTMDGMIRVSGSEMVTVSAYVRASVSRNVQLRAESYEDSGGTLTYIGSTVSSQATVGTTWARLSATGLAHPRATHVRVGVYATTTGSAGQWVDANCLMVSRGAWLTDYFDGGFANTATYAYRWNGPAGHGVGTTSDRVALVDERTPDVFTWEPDVNGWEFLEPLTSLVGLRLFCDESRDWRLIDPDEYALPGLISVAGWNAAEGVDRISRDDPNIYCTGVVVRYRWRDANGVDRYRADTAGTPGLILIWEYNRPYPGPGAAAAILARRAGQGRVQDVTALADWAASPAVEASISLPGTVDQIGQISAVTWTLGDALMRVATRGLTEAAPGTIIALTGTIDELVGTIDEL